MELLDPKFTWENGMLRANYAGHSKAGHDVVTQLFKRVPLAGPSPRRHHYQRRHHDDDRHPDPYPADYPGCLGKHGDLQRPAGATSRRYPAPA